MKSYKLTARKVHETYSRLLKGKLRAQKPAWFTAMELYPPNPSIFRNPSHYDTSGTTDFEKKNGKSSESKQINNFVVPPRSANTKNKLRLRRDTPPEIVYPEDKLRRKFFADHPAETVKPVSLLQSQVVDQPWNSIDNPVFGLSGESVIRYQWYLINQGLPEKEAYERATKEYYKAKARQELEKKIATMEAVQYGSLPVEKIHSKITLAFENKQLRISKRVIERANQIKESQSAATEKSFM